MIDPDFQANKTIPYSHLKGWEYGASGQRQRMLGIGARVADSIQGCWRTKDQAMHGNQKTYFVLPHVDASRLTPEDMEHLAALTRKYHIPKLHITGAQRVALLGMEPDALAALQAELGIAETLPHDQRRVHYVHACPGRAWCRFGQADTAELRERIKAIELDGPLPHRVKVGISGCRFCCSASWLRDVGLAAEKKGWRFSFGGNGAGRPRVGDVVAEGLSDDEAVALVTKTLNYYLREARPKTRSARFMERIGVDALKKSVLG